MATKGWNRLILKRIIVLLIALAAWLYPIHAVGAFFAPETKQDATQLPTAPVATTETVEKPSPSQPKAKTATQQTKPPTTGGYNGRHYSKDEVQQLIRDYSAQYGINADTPLCIARNESGFNQFSKNSHSTASGVFQYLTSTWRQTDEGRAGLSVFDADANVKAAVKYMASRLNTVPWVVGPRCPRVQRI